MTPEALREKIYAGLLGKAVGVRLGAPVEPTVWDHDRIRDTYGEIDGYVRDYRNFAADDDTNGPLVFLRALSDEGPLTPETAGRNWLNYIADGHGMLWWGGVGVSTEETAYRRLLAGETPPETGSIHTNGLISAEQIGGQIFSDCWGWVAPGDPAEAARMARIMASVSHDGEALEGAAYVAAATAAAFVSTDIAEVHRCARGHVAGGSHYARVIDAVADWHERHPDDWRSCFAMLERDFGYDKWTGVCHVIPNAGVVVLSLLYGQGDMPRTAAIATMCGWDTDCNAGNAANIAGVLQGVQPSWDKWRRPINDILILSAVTGATNIVDLPSVARDLAALALRSQGEPVPEGWGDPGRDICFDFTLPGATHGLRAEGSHRLRLVPGLSGDALDVQIDRWAGGDSGKLFWKPFYRRADFDDDRYRPMLSPLTAAGQQVEITLRGSSAFEGPREVRFAPYVRFATSGEERMLADPVLLPDDWQTIRFTLPDSVEAVDEIGLRLEQGGAARVMMYAQIRRMTVTGPGRTRIDPSCEAEEWGSVSRFSFNRGVWRLEEGRISGHSESDADLWTGHPGTADQRVSAEILPGEGTSHLVTLRAAGARRFYAAGIENGVAVILREDFGRKVLAETPLPRPNGPMQLSFEARGHRLGLTIDGVEILSASDDRHPRGMAGLRMAAPGTLSCGHFEIEEF